MAHTINGPSSGNAPGDDGGDYAIFDADGNIIGEAFRVIAAGIEADAKANAQLFATAPEMERLLRKIGWVLEQPCWRTYGALATLRNDIKDLIGVE